MGLGQGFAAKAAFRREGRQSAYGTPVLCSINHLMPMLPDEDLQREIAKDMDNQAQYGGGHGASEMISRLVSGPVTFRMPYWGLEQFILCGLGWANPPETVDSGVYKHLIEPADNLHTEKITAGDAILAGDGWLAGDYKVRRGTLCIEKTVSIWEFISVMVQSLTFRGNAQGVWVDADLVPYDLDRASAVNTSSAGWTAPFPDWHQVFFQDMIFRIGDYSVSTPLSSGDELGIRDFEIKIENHLEIKQDSRSGLYIAEPRRDKKRLVTGSFTFSRYENDTFLDDLDAQNPMMAMLQFTGPEIFSSGYDYTLWIWLPTLRFDMVGAPIDSPGLIAVTHTFTAEIPEEVPAGFPSGADKEIAVQFQIGSSKNLLIAS